jgi:hypothetical protein
MYIRRLFVRHMLYLKTGRIRNVFFGPGSGHKFRIRIHNTAFSDVWSRATALDPFSSAGSVPLQCFFKK